MRIFIPEKMFDNIYQITPSLLKKHGVCAVAFDLDNTVAPYEVHMPTEKMKKYFDALAASGIDTALVSNNKSERVELFNSNLKLFAVPDAHKPSSKGIEKCVEHFGIPRAQILFVGDQIFTDCLAAHKAKIRCFVVKPIAPKETLFFKFKRVMEKPFVKLYKIKNGDK